LCRPPALLLLLMLNGCSTAAPSTQWASWSPLPVVGPTAGIPPSTQKRPQVEIEGDGLEGQLPPRQRAEDALDNPAEPFSPNYGSPNYGSAPAPAAEPKSAPEPV
jgi:hypothetical protein